MFTLCGDHFCEVNSTMLIVLILDLNIILYCLVVIGLCCDGQVSRALTAARSLVQSLAAGRDIVNKATKVRTCDSISVLRMNKTVQQ